MILRRLILEDFGLYRGVQQIELAPREKNGRVFPVILFGGKNGAGKSTLFEAILICLYGRGAFGERVGQSEYQELLFQRIHRSALGVRESSRSSITIEFDFVEAGVLHTYEVTRSWIASRGNAASIDVSLNLRRDGQRLDDLDHSHWDDFLRELIPSGLSQLFFFDGEKIQRLADEQDSSELGRSVKSLLNLDLVERLHADLQIYVAKQAKEVANDSERQEMEQLEQHRDQLNNQLEQLQSDRASLQATKLDHIASVIERLERRLRSEGSELAKARGALLDEKVTLLSAIHQNEERLRELSTSVLPFAICPDTLSELKDALATSNAAMTSNVAREILSITDGVFRDFVGSRLAGSELIDQPVRKRAASVLKAALGQAIKSATQGPSDSVGMDDISASDRARLLTWIQAALSDAAPEAKRILEKLEKHTRQLQKVEASLLQVPTEESLKQVINELNAAHRELGAAQQQANTFEAQAEKVRRELSELDARINKLTSRFQEATNNRDRIATVKRSQIALREYLVAVTDLKLRHLEEEVTKCFGELCRKSDLVRAVRIDATTFNIVLLDHRGEPLPKERLSAGEKQIFAVALLWALGRTSGRPLPVIIDTPLARLDSSHRRLLVERYLPAASHQVLVLSTDTEVDANLFAELKPHVSHAYHLEYDAQEKCTTANPGYFWIKNVDLETATCTVLNGS